MLIKDIDMIVTWSYAAIERRVCYALAVFFIKWKHIVPIPKAKQLFSHRTCHMEFIGANMFPMTVQSWILVAHLPLATLIFLLANDFSFK